MIFRPEYEYKYSWGDIFDEYKYKLNLVDLFFFGKYKYKYIQIPCFRRMKIKIFSALPKVGEYEYKLDYSNWYFQLQIRVYNTIFFFLYKSYDSMQIIAYLCHNIQFLVLGLLKKKKKINDLLLCWQIWIQIYFLQLILKRANTNRKIFGLKKREIQIQMY